MVIENEAVNNIIKQYISEVTATLPVNKVYLYGSYANGTARWDSDVDLCFFSGSFSYQNIDDIMGKLFKIKRQYNKYVCLEPNAFPLSEIYNDNPFVKEILRTGVEIYSS